MGKTFKRCKSAGYKKIHHGAGEEYAGLSKRQVLMSVTSNEQLRNFNVRFTNKTKPRPVSVKRIQEQHQIDLLGMKSMKVEYKKKCYQYIFLLIWNSNIKENAIDIFFRWWTYFTDFFGLLHLQERKTVMWKRNCNGSIKNMHN